MSQEQLKNTVSPTPREPHNAGIETHNGLPVKQGLYDPRFEHDACGIGFIANIKGKKSNAIVRDALTILLNLDHRGALGADPNTGDGAGILIQLPDKFLRSVCLEEKNLVLPPAGDYGVGMVFLPQDEELRHGCMDHIAAIIREEGQKLIGWRNVPTNDMTLGATSRDSQPIVRMVFVGRQHVSGIDFERKLYKIRRRVTNAVKHVERIDSTLFYIASMSSRTIVYKGMLTPMQVDDYFRDLNDPRIESAIALVHSRFSTNTFPSWARAHPYRYAIHNGEINTLRGNINWMKARQAMIETDIYREVSQLFPIVDEDGSDTGMMDNVLEFLVMNGFPLVHAAMMMIPEPWQRNETMQDDKRAFYEYHACLMEPWDGPAAVAMTDGRQIVATLDRNGLRPSRYYVTHDDRIILASEVGVLDIAPDNIKAKGRLEPGKMLVVDTEEGRIISDEEIKATLASEHPYRDWLDNNLVQLKSLPSPAAEAVPATLSASDLTQMQMAFGYTFEDLRILMAPMAEKGVEALGSMGDDTPLAVLSQRQRLLYDYFKQLFAQVTNPPIDAIREEMVTATETYLGTEGNMLMAEPSDCIRIKLKYPVLSNEELAKLRHIDHKHFRSETLPILYDPHKGGAGLETALDNLFAGADRAIEAGSNLLILSDRGVTRGQAAIPALLATAALHHHLISEGTRMKVSLIVESAEPREVHHFACLIGYGAEAINPYLAYETLQDILDKRLVLDVTYEEAVAKYVKAVMKGVIKILSKMGISTIQSYSGAQIFEALGLSQRLVDKYFTNTPTRIEGSDIHIIAKEVLERHTAAFPERPSNGHALPVGGKYQHRNDGEDHGYDPKTVHALQHACREGDYDAFKQYSSDVNDKEQRLNTLRGLLRLKKSDTPIPLDEVESVDEILKRFKTGAMSYGSISMEAHTALAIAMNRIGGRSNTGEGGEASWRYEEMAGKSAADMDIEAEHYVYGLRPGDSAKSKIKQVASGRFGVTSEYLISAEEIQIKMAQGAKPGEGGQLPGHKVYPWIAKTRGTMPGVGLISPPPHHDIYSIEDLAQLIFDLKNANPDARINVKLVSEVGVGTIAAGVAKGHADVILISGYSGGTGAAAQTSVKHCGLPWELGLAETHQTLMINDLRSRVRLETDGQLKTGRDVIIAALLGAEEYGFSTAPLISLGCIMMRVCHLNTCPVGVATQNPELRKRFTGKPEHAENFMLFVAQEVRELLAEMGMRSMNDLIGRVNLLDADAAVDHWKAQGIDLSNLLYQPAEMNEAQRYCTTTQDHGLDKTYDSRILLGLCEPTIERGEKVRAELPLRNIYRTVGTMTGNAIVKKHGQSTLPDDTVQIKFNGSAGQSFGAFIPKGMTFIVSGDANDFLGKGLCGGKLVVAPHPDATFVPEENITIGNVALYGATAGEMYIRGMAGERFAVRNSGATAVVEGVGDHGCEYMTGGRVIVLGKTGRNFAAGMSGGIAYVIDEDDDFATRVNSEMCDVEPLASAAETADLKQIIESHVAHTKSTLAQGILDNWEAAVPYFKRVIPRDYRRVLDALDAARQEGYSEDEAAMIAFEANKKDVSRIMGK